jgi:SnoaL-like polyketide cyclase
MILPQPQQLQEHMMSKEKENKAIVGLWFKEFWGNPWNPEVVDELAASDMLLQYSLHAPRRGRENVKAFMTGFREAFPDLKFEGAADLIAEGATWWVAGKAAARKPGRLSVTLSSVRSPQLPVARCTLPALRCFALKKARLLMRSVWTMASLPCNSLASSAPLDGTDRRWHQGDRGSETPSTGTPLSSVQ